MNKTALMILLAVCATLLAACGERQQTLSGTHRKSDAPAWQGASDDPFVAKGWTAGDQTSWRNQIQQRNQYQNEYNRTP